MSSGYGWKARIGPRYPSDGLCDCETQLMAPEGIQFLNQAALWKCLKFLGVNQPARGCRRLLAREFDP